jgi:protein SCO1/2
MPIGRAGSKAIALALAALVAAAPGDSLQGATVPLELTFLDADGQLVRLSDFPGRWLLVYFGYTHCTDLCPTGLSVLATALEEIGPAADHIQPLFVTVDPERDTGALLATFSRSFGPRLIGLGGTLQQIREAAAALGVSFQKVAQGASDYVVDHSSSYSLIDPQRTRVEVLRVAEPHLLAAKLIEELSRAGAPLGNVNNWAAFR